jgi:general secretion pathway protein B
MSSILKALQKVEEEKAARNGDGSGLPSNTLRAERKSERSWLPLLLGMAGIAAVAVLITFYLMGGFSGRQGGGVVTKAAPATGNGATVLPVTMTPQPASPMPDVPALPAVPAGTVKVQENSSMMPKGAKMEVRQGLPPKPELVTPRVGNPNVTAESEEVVKTTPVSKGQKAVLPRLKVSGIAWQKEDAASVAVVNGTPVMKGHTIDGFKVEDIFRDRVRFAGEGKTFELSIGESKSADTKAGSN